MKRALLLTILCAFSAAFSPWMTWGAPSKVSCVDPCGGGDFTDLQAALSAAESNSVLDFIKVAQGTYTDNFTYESDQGYAILIYGGYKPCTGCAIRELDPSKTILDGSCDGSVLVIKNNLNGDIVVDGFTIQNGSGSTAYYGGGVDAVSDNNETTGIVSAGNITITNNIVTRNAAISNGGGIYASSQSTVGAAGDIIVNNNIIYENSVADYDGGGVLAESYSSSGMAGNVIMINNLIYNNSAGRFGEGVAALSDTHSGTAGTIRLINNTITENCDTGVCYGLFMSAKTVYCYNNIVWGNTDSLGADIYLNSEIVTAQGANNDYESLFGSWTVSGLNLHVNPLLTSKYHLNSRSPCIDMGKNDPPGGLPSTDFEGDTRIIDGNNSGVATVDIGADEYVPKRTIAPFLILLLN
ncbi:MAG: right-handed parallel beta-helix repeat-containing protein [Deltaproteobacteria bacterium]|nr:right-handed parallel beta-helix repeat-containing protein [Deltaproteobacteria bacterium]